MTRKETKANLTGMAAAMAIARSPAPLDTEAALVPFRVTTIVEAF